MANINGFKYIKLQSKNMYKYIPNITTQNINAVQKERLGFYHLILEKITGIQDAIDIQNLIQDQEYVKFTNGIQERDLGIDAIYINSESSAEKEIMLFNFKYRNEFNPDKTTSEKDISTSMKFFQYIKNGSNLPTTINKEAKVYKNIKEIRKCIRSDDIYNITLYLVTNEAHGLSQDADEIAQAFSQSYDMKIKTISLDDIISFIDMKKEEVSSTIIFPSNDLIDYKIDEKSTSVSYVCKLSLLDLIRITCDNATMRETYNWDKIDESKFKLSNLQYSLLYDNVRGYLGETNYNKKIYDTIGENPKQFFMFNNGITITSAKIKCEKVNLAEKHLLVLDNFQIVNGGQTLRSAYNYFLTSQDDTKLDNLRNSKVLVRIFKIDNETDPLKNHIAEYTNSQNAISPVDLKSVSQVQLEIERHLKAQKVLYIRKAGDVGNTAEIYDLRISMEKFTQILYSSQGYPERVSNVKKRLFSDYYDDIYNENFRIENSKQLIECYFEVEKYYKENNLNVYDQKVFYIVYLFYKYKITIEDSHLALSKALQKYPGGQKEARILLRKDFKIYLDEIINNK